MALLLSGVAGCARSKYDADPADTNDEGAKQQEMIPRPLGTIRWQPSMQFMRKVWKHADETNAKPKIKRGTV